MATREGGMIARLRRLGGTWTAERQGFGSYAYAGEWRGHRWSMRAFAHMAERFDGDDDSFVTMWHIERDGEPFGCPTKDPAGALWLEATNGQPA